MSRTNFKISKPIPSISTAKSSPVTVNFPKGVVTYKPNDAMSQEEIRLAQDARFDKVGEYGTRYGYKQLTEPIGKTSLSGNISGTYESTSAKGATPYIYDATSSKPIYSVVVTLAKTTNNYVVPKVIITVDGELVSSSCIDPSKLTKTMKQFEVVFMDTPNIFESETAEISIGVQTGELSDLSIATINGAIMAQVNTATEGAITSVFEANIDGDKSVLFVQNRVLYRLDSAGVVHTIRTLPEGATTVRFNQDLNQIRYVDGVEAPHLLDPGSNWADSAIPVTDLATGVELNVTMRNIMDGTSDNLIYFATDPDTEALWTYPYGYQYAKTPAFSTTATIDGNPGDTLTIDSRTISPSGIAVGDWITGQGRATAEVTAISGTTVSLVIVDTTPQVISSYDKFSTDFYQNFPAIKTGDPLTAMFNLGGVLYFMTRRNKYQMYSQSADSWSQSNTNAQNGTFSQESIVCDLNYAYFANENGVYVFDGSSESSLTQNTIQNVYDAIPDKQNIVLDLFRNRLYVFYTSIKGGVNDHCLVYNINLRVWESFDSNTWVSATSARQNVSSRFLCGHSRIGMLMLAEDISDNDYSDIGQPIAFNLETSYQPFGVTSQLKRITKWRPEFARTKEPYTIECGYSLDYNDIVKYAFSIQLDNQDIVDLGYVWDNPSDYGVPAVPTVHTTLPQVYKEFYRCQIRYQHIASFEPVIFRSHTLTIQTQRIR